MPKDVKLRVRTYGVLSNPKAVQVKIMALKSNISITQFMFTLEEFLLENHMISNRRELDWDIVEYYKNFVIRNFPGYFQLDKKQFASFTKNYNKTRKIFEKYRNTVDLEPLNILLRQARDVALGIPPSMPPRADELSKMLELQSQVLTDVNKALRQGIADLKQGIADLNVELCDLKILAQRLASVPNVADRSVASTPRADATDIEPAPVSVPEQPRRAGLPKAVVQSGSGAAQPATNLYKQVLQSVESKRPIARARQRVALCILYITGLNASKLPTLQVSHLKQLRDSADAVEILRSYTGRIVQDANELVADIYPDLDILIATLPDNSPRITGKASLGKSIESSRIDP